MDLFLVSFNSRWQKGLLALIGATLLIMLIVSIVRLDFAAIFLMGTFEKDDYEIFKKMLAKTDVKEMPTKTDSF